jgi:hypothetical protein
MGTSMTERRPSKTKKREHAEVFTIEANPCVWMKARVVNFKLCHNTYDCLNCPFDKAMSEAWSQSSEPGK